MNMFEPGGGGSHLGRRGEGCWGRRGIPMWLGGGGLIGTQARVSIHRRVGEGPGSGAKRV